MKPSQGGVHTSCALAPSQMGKTVISIQIVILVALVTSTAIITRAVVLSTIAPNTKFTSPEFQFTPCTTKIITPTSITQPQPASRNPARIAQPGHASSSPARIAQRTTSRFDDEPRNLTMFTSYRDALDTSPFDLHGYIISMKKDRYDYASSVLRKLRITPHHFVPYPYTSQLVWDEMQKFNNGSLVYHKDPHNLKMFSHRMAHTSMLFDFVNDPAAKMNSWRFFFEDDVELHPSVDGPDARAALRNALDVGAGDGIVYLGVCGPGKPNEPAVQLARGVIARRSHGTCTHAYGVTKWRAAGLLSHIDRVRVPERHPRLAYMYFDILTRAYGETVTKAYVVGYNLKSPVPQKFLAKQAHVGLVYQDRFRYPSFISPKQKNDTHANPPL